MLYCDAATFCRRRNDAGIMTDETGRRCAQESIDIIIMKNNYNYLFIIKIILITYLYANTQPHAITILHPHHADNLQQTLSLRKILRHKHLRTHILPIRQGEDKSQGQEP